MEWDANNKIFDNVLEVIGRTPMIRLNKIGKGLKPDICAKLEYVNPSGSLKDRVVHKIVEEAEKRGDLKPGMILLEGTGLRRLIDERCRSDDRKPRKRSRA